MSISKIRIGTYGAPGAGKTRFFWQLVRGNQLPVHPGSKLAQFLVAATGPDGQILPTTAQFDDIEIMIDRVFYFVSDWRGDVLAASLDKVDLGVKSFWSRNAMRDQTLDSDVFFFFFNPTGRADKGRLLQHHRDEMLKAKQLIDYVVAVRQNRLMPIMFILGHEDQVKNDPELVRLTDKWVDEVENYLAEAFDEQLLGYYPKQFTREELVFHRISCTDPSHAADLIEVMDRAKNLVETALQFRSRDRKRSFRLVLFFLLCSFLFLILPFLCLTSPLMKKILLELRNQAAPVLQHLPSIPLSMESPEERELQIELDTLLKPEAELDKENAQNWNKTLFLLMKRLNKLEDTGKTDSEEYKDLSVRWKNAFQQIDQRFDAPTNLSVNEKSERMTTLLGSLADSSKRDTKSLNDVLQKYWNFTRQRILRDLKVDLADNREAGTPSKQILETLSRKLEANFREVSESRVRGDVIPQGMTDQFNKKETLKQEIRKAYIACRNYGERYQVEIKIVAAHYAIPAGERTKTEIPSDPKPSPSPSPAPTTPAAPDPLSFALLPNPSDVNALKNGAKPDEKQPEKKPAREIDRDIFRRLVFSGGIEKGETAVDLAISTGFQSNTECAFLPSRQEVSISCALDQPLKVSVQGKPKGSQGTWSDVAVWNIDSQEQNEPSLKPLGLSFYLRYENDENTVYYPEGKGYKFELVIRRPRNVPEFLWEIVSH